MDITDARKILNVDEDEEEGEIKKKYRKLISCYHPDAVGSEHRKYRKKAQEINEAYRLLKLHSKQRIRKERAGWSGKRNPNAFVQRNIYTRYSMDGMADAFRKVACGKYMWNPEEEEFHCFLKSVHQVSKELLMEIEHEYEMFEEKIEKHRFTYQVHLFRYLSLQFIQPLECLEKMRIKPEEINQTGESRTYHFRGFLGAKRAEKNYLNLASLKSGAILYPMSLSNQRIYVCDEKQRELGHLSLEEDALYFCIIPLLKAHLAQVKLLVKEVELNRKHHPYTAKVEVDFWLRVEEKAKSYENPDQNGKIHQLLEQYRKLIFKEING